MTPRPPTQKPSAAWLHLRKSLHKSLWTESVTKGSSDSHREQVWLTATNANQELTAAVQGTKWPMTTGLSSLYCSTQLNRHTHFCHSGHQVSSGEYFLQSTRSVHSRCYRREDSGSYKQQQVPRHRNLNLALVTFWGEWQLEMLQDKTAKCFHRRKERKQKRLCFSDSEEVSIYIANGTRHRLDKVRGISGMCLTFCVITCQRSKLAFYGPTWKSTADFFPHRQSGFKQKRSWCLQIPQTPC